MSSSGSKRACDACHRRKPPQKKGPKGSRAKVISELRKTQDHDPTRPSSSPNDGRASLDSPLGSPLATRARGLLPTDTIPACVSYFFENFYPTMPILDQGRMKQTVTEMDTKTEAYCLIGSLCAFVVIQPDFHIRTAGDRPQFSSIRQVSAQCLRLVEETLRAWNGYDHKDSPTLTDVLIAFFLSAAYFGLEKANAAWIHLREAITLAQLLGMHDEGTYKRGDVDGDIRRRLFWLLYVSERGYALHKHRPLALHATIEYPVPTGDSTDAIAITGLICLCNLFRIIDDTFSRVWNTARSECSTIWLSTLQRQLDEALPEELNCPEAQEADLRISQQWLKIVVWQMSTASGCLSSTSTDAFMSFTYPIDVSKEIFAITSRLSPQSIEVHGIGLLEKLFDIACTLIDVMSCVPLETTTFEVGPRDYLVHFHSLISSLRRGESRYVALLEGKIRDTLPTMAATLSLSLPPASLERVLTQDEGSLSSNSSPYNSPSSMSSVPRFPAFQVPPSSPSAATLPSSLPVPGTSPAGRPVYGRLPFQDGHHRIFP
ncbi:hypothetical protein MMC26_007111 [Xylographa opegraphella]|nr:hypothetical protein [Xylographa opegraphella]